MALTGSLRLCRLSTGEGLAKVVNSREWGLTAVERRSTTERVLGQLRAAIVAGHIGPNEQLRETALAQSMGTGRSAVREAIRHLVQEGLVETRVNRGAFVRVLTPGDSDDVYLAREVIEVAAVRQALARPRALDLRALRAAFARIQVAVAQAPAEQPAGGELIAADLDFHRALVALSDSPRLIRAHETLAAEAQMLMHHQPVYPLTDYAADHGVLLDAVTERSPDAPERVRDHLRLSAALIAQELRQHPDPSHPPSRRQHL